MKLRKVLKKFIASMLVLIIFIGQLSGLKVETEATNVNSSGEHLYLALSALRESGMGYAIDMTSSGTEGKQLWGIRSYQTASSSSSSVVASNLYCIRGSYGYTWETAGKPTDIVTYSQSTLTQSILNNGHYYELLWVVDNMYIPGETDKATFLQKIGINSYEDETYGTFYYYDSDLTPGHDYSDLVSADEFQYTLTDDDIIAIQQAVVWYYTNYSVDGVYNKLGRSPSWLKYTTNGTSYAELSSLNSGVGEGPARSEFAILLYNYLINEANKEVASAGGTYTLKNREVKLWTSNVNGGEEQPIIEVHKKTEKNGSYNVVLVKQDENGEELNSTATFTIDNVDKVVTGRLTIADNVAITSANVGTVDTYVIKEKTPPDEYCAFDGIITVSVTKGEVGDKYAATNVSYVVRDSAGTDITNQVGTDVNVYLKDGNIYVEVKDYPEEKAFDLALRKVITAVKDSQGNTKSIVNESGANATRNIVVDRSTLNNEDDDRNTDTATYRHRKDPVLIENGDKVSYSLTIYNEGQQAGYARKIVDQLPGTWSDGLRLTSITDVTSSTGNVYSIEYSAQTNTVTFTLKSTNPKTIPAYNGTTLSQETIILECEVMTTADTAQKITLTNIAYISEEYNSETNEVITTVGDRDSQPTSHPSYQGESDSKQDGMTYGNDIGYKGNASNSTDLGQSNTYYKGQQDDDDFEKLVILPIVPGKYNLQLIKVERGNASKLLSGAVFKITVNGTESTKTTDENGQININDIVMNEAGKQTITIEETMPPNGYNKILTEPLTIEVTVKFEDRTYKIENVEMKNTDTKGSTMVLEGSTIKVTVPNEKIVGDYNIRILKKDTENKVVAGAKFKVELIDTNNNVLKTYNNLVTNNEGLVETTDINIEGEGTYRYRITETEAPTGYKKEETPTVIDVTARIADGVYKVTYTKVSGNKETVTNVGNTIQITMVNEAIFDLSLRKVITKVDGVSTESNREIKVTGLSNLSTGTTGTTTAQYNHIKQPLIVKNKSIVTYNINIYNEAYMDGIATIIKDQLPLGLKLDLTSLQKQTVEENTQYYVMTTKNNKYIVNYDETTNMITFTLDTTSTVTNLQAFRNRTTLDSDTIEINCIVDCTADREDNIYLTNIAYIYEEKRADGVVVTNQRGKDRDSEPYTRPNKTADELNTVGEIGYIGNTSNPSDLAKDNTYYKGEQDDDDFEKLVILPQAFDLKLIKYIDEVNGKDVENRILNVDTSKLNKTGADGERITTAEYEMEKNPVSVKALDLIKYTFRIYNEGDYDGYATEISEDIPKGLEVLIVDRDTSNNPVIYSWDGKDLKDITDEIKATGMLEKVVATNSSWKYRRNTSIITTEALKDQKIKAFGIKDYTNYADQENKIDYKEISVIFRVKADVVVDKKAIRNEAAITNDKAVDDDDNEIIDEDGNPIEDRDSKPEEWKKEDSGKDYNEDGWEIYKEDDEDYDNIIVKEFDLSLRKQITKITRNSREDLYTGRYAKLDPENTEENTIYTYYNVYENRPKVRAGDIVTYSIRVYNEGEIDGYAKLIADALPSGLEFEPYTEGDGSINDKYGWKLVEGTTNVYETDYLSYEKDTNKGTENSNLIKAYTESGEADYKEVEIQCRVKDNVTKSDSLLNVAQIADDSDEDGKPIKDKDSEPGKTDDEKKWKEEDDLDIEILQLEEFDLALRKFITQIEETGVRDSRNEDDEIQTTEVTSRIPEISYDKETNQITYTHSKDPLIVHVKDTVIYTIRVFNEGDIDGYAQEVTDDIPEYLEYLPEHKTNVEYNWEMYDAEGNMTEDVTRAVKIKTNYLAKGEGKEKDTEEGDSNYTSNLIKTFNPEAGISDTNPDYRDLKVAFKVKDPNSSEYIIRNFAQISEDADEEGDPIDDIDSEPDNGEEEPKEDDEDIENVKVEYFDLALLKYVTKAILIEDGKEVITETGNVGDENDIIPKVEVNKKLLDKTVVKFAYTIKITNEGDIAGYAKEITDYIPEGLEFKAEDNPNWIDEGNRVISTRALENVLLQPGQSSEVEVILTWINGEHNLGPKINIAEISEDDNDEDIPDKDSTPDNEEEGEDDIDDAEVVLSIKTGGTANMAIIILISILFLIVLVGIIEKTVIKRFLKE